jgi:hypothetical protein
MSEEEKRAQLTALLTKSVKFIAANLNAIEKEVYVFAIKAKRDKCVLAVKTLKIVADLLAAYPEPELNYVPRVLPDSFKAKVNDDALLKLVASMDAVLALVRAKLIPLIKLIKTGQPSAQLSSDVIKVNGILKAYIGTLVQDAPAPSVQ